MRRKIVLATKNKDKVKEITEILNDLNLDLLTLDEFPEAPDVLEDGATLEENAVKKAKLIAEHTGLISIADDTGLEVDYLDGQPGVRSSRYSGENATYSDNVNKLLAELKGVPRDKRSARFRCEVALFNNTHVETVKAVCEGIIAEAPRGEGGFGYDPVFYVPEYGRTFAEMGPELKNRISHRAKAFGELRKRIQRGEISLDFEST